MCRTFERQLPVYPANPALNPLNLKSLNPHPRRTRRVYHHRPRPRIGRIRFPLRLPLRALRNLRMLKLVHRSVARRAPRRPVTAAPNYPGTFS